MDLNYFGRPVELSHAELQELAQKRITRIEMKNIMKIGYICLDLTKPGIYHLDGYNAAGKTSFDVGMAVWGYNFYPKDLSKIVRWGETEAFVKVTFENDMSIERYFALDAKAALKTHWYELLLPDGRSYNTKAGEKHFALEDNKVPYYVSAIINFALESETKQMLNIRREEDGLLMAKTSGSVNYKSVNSALSIERLTTAINLSNVESNKLLALQKDAIAKEAYIVSNIESLKVKDFDKLEDALDSFETNFDKIQVIENLVALDLDREEIAQSVGVTFPLIDTSKFEVIGAILGTVKQVEDIQIPTAVNLIDSNKVNRLNRLENLIHLAKEVNDITTGSQIELVKESKLVLFRDLSKLKDALQGLLEASSANLVPLNLLDIKKFNLIESIIKQWVTYDTISANTGNKIDLLDIEKFNKLEKLVTLGIEVLNTPVLSKIVLVDEIPVKILSEIDRIKRYASDFEKNELALKAACNERDAFLEEIKQSGYNYCPNCSHVLESEIGGVSHVH